MLAAGGVIDVRWQLIADGRGDHADGPPANDAGGHGEEIHSVRQAACGAYEATRRICRDGFETIRGDRMFRIHRSANIPRRMIGKMELFPCSIMSLASTPAWGGCSSSSRRSRSRS